MTDADIVRDALTGGHSGRTAAGLAALDRLVAERDEWRKSHDAVYESWRKAVAERDALATRLRDAPLGGGGSHWDGCWRAHIDCALVKIDALNVARASAEAERDRLRERATRLLYIAEHLAQMVPQDVWREHGAEWMGQYEGDYHAEQVRDELGHHRAALEEAPDADA